MTTTAVSSSGSTFLNGVKTTYAKFADWTAKALAPKETDGTVAKTAKVVLNWLGSFATRAYAAVRDGANWLASKVVSWEAKTPEKTV